MPPLRLSTSRVRLVNWLSTGIACASLLSGISLASATDNCPTGVCIHQLSGHAIRPQDEVWTINTRGLCATTPEQVISDLQFERYVPEKGWTRQAFTDFAAQPAGMVTSFFVVGNRYTHAEALQTGWYAYHRLVAQCADNVALRFVIWSWPSDPVPARRLFDARLKLTRVDPSAFHLAAIVDRLDPATPISMCGSSFGSGIAAGAMQLLAGGKLGRYQLLAKQRPKRKIRVVMIDAAINNDALAPGHKYGLALSQTERTLVFVNPADFVLRVYHRLFGRRRNVWALGLTGPAGLGRSPDTARLDLGSSNPYVGREHGMMPYWQSPTLVAWMRPYLLMQPLSEKKNKTNKTNLRIGAR